MAAFGHALVEAVASLQRGRLFAALAICTIGAAVFVLGCILLVTTNLERLSEEWRSAAELSVFLTDEATSDDRRRVEGVLAPGPVVATYEFVSKADALGRFRDMFGDLAPAVDVLGENPLPASYEVRLQSTADAQLGLERVVRQLRAMSGVEDVRYDRQWLERLSFGVAVVRRVGLALSAILALAAALTATTVVRLALNARRDELDIMELVGSPSAFVRGPFIMEGALQGAIGGIVSVAAMLGAFVLLRERYLTTWAVTLNMTTVQFLTPLTCAALVCGATLVGGLAGLAAARSRERE